MAALGLANAVLYSLLDDDVSVGPFDRELQQWPRSVLYAPIGILAGLLISGAFLRFSRRDSAEAFSAATA